MQKAGSNIIDLVKNEYFVQWIVSPTEESTHYWLKWIATHPERKQDVELARQLITSAEYKIDDSMPEGDYNSVLENIVSYSQKKKTRDHRLVPISWGSIGVAATLVLALFLGILGAQYVFPIEDHSVVDTETIKKSTLPGQKLTIQLPDGSSVTLNAESEVTYSLPFTSNRNLTLTGEAFFQVTKDKNNPFTVRTGDITTKVLGTSFNVRSYPEESTNSIAVVTGKVEVSDKQGNHAYLIPNVRGVFTLGEKQLLIEPFSVDRVVGWKDGLLTFENASVSKVFSQLERWYGVKIYVKDKTLLLGEYTGYYKNAYLEKVMNGIGFAVGFEYSINDHEVIINKNE